VRLLEFGGKFCDLRGLVGVAWSFWPWMIMVISSARRATLGKKISPRPYDFIMHLLPVAEVHLRFALHSQAYRALGWDTRVIRVGNIVPMTNWSAVAGHFGADRLSMISLHAAPSPPTNSAAVTASACA